MEEWRRKREDGVALGWFGNPSESPWISKSLTLTLYALSQRDAERPLPT